MPIRNSIVLAVTSVFLALSLPVIAECSPASPDAKTSDRLTPEQQAMMFRDAHDKLNSMPADQRKAYKQQLRQQWASLTPSQKADKRAQLDAEWNALPQARRAKIEAHLQGSNQEKGNQDKSTTPAKDGDGQ